MSRLNIESLIAMLEKGELTKGELLTAVNKGRLEPRENSEAEMPILASEKSNVRPCVAGNLLARNCLEHIHTLEQEFEPMLLDSTNEVNAGGSRCPAQHFDPHSQAKPQPDPQPLPGVASPLPVRSSLRRTQQKEAESKGRLRHNNRSCSQLSLKAERVSEAEVSAINKSFLQREESFKQQRESRRKEWLRLLEQREIKECSFHPSINKSRGGGGESGLLSVRESVEERLLKPGKKQESLAKLRRERAEQLEREHRRNCTFHPQVNSNMGVRPRYLEVLKDPNTQASVTPSRRPQSSSGDNQNCSFQPSVNRVHKSMKQAQEYLQLDAYTRLSQSKNEAQKMLWLYGACRDVELFSEEEARSQQTDKSPSQGKRLQEFYERQKAFEAQKQESKEQRLRELQQPQVPRINKKSEQIVASLVDFQERNQVLLSRKEEYLRRQDAQRSQPSCSFHPRILKQSKDLPKKSVEEMSYGPMAVREMKLRELKEALVRNEAESCTFYPKTSTQSQYSSVESKLHIQDTVSTYLKRIKLLNEKKENLAQLSHQSQEHQSLIECTHKPRITELPYYIRNSPSSVRSSVSSKIQVQIPRKSAYAALGYAASRLSKQ